MRLTTHEYIEQKQRPNGTSRDIAADDSRLAIFV
jgi:hypothetical protein